MVNNIFNHNYGQLVCYSHSHLEDSEPIKSAVDEHNGVIAEDEEPDSTVHCFDFVDISVEES